MCFARDVDVVFLLHDSVRDEHYCPQCAYSASAGEVEARLSAYCAARYRMAARPHPFASRVRETAEGVRSDER